MQRTWKWILLIGGILILLLSIFYWFSIQPCISIPLGATRPWLVVYAYNPEGGFFWFQYNVLHAAHLAEKYGLTLIVRHNSGLYLEHDEKYLKSLESTVPTIRKGNWFEYYFQPIGTEQQQHIISQYEKSKRRIPSFGDFLTKTNKTSPIYQWDRHAFNHRDCQNQQENLSKQWKRVIRLQPWIEQEWNELKRQFGFNDPNKQTIGVHIRLTDKWRNKTDSEDFPIHHDNEIVSCVMDQYLEKERKKNKNVHADRFQIFACSDEHPTIHFLKERYKQQGITVHATNSLRSNMDTSGLDLKSWKCSSGFQGPEYTTDPDCQLYKQSREWSIHRGFQQESRYKKGKDVLLDVLCLSECCFFFASRGNVSQFPYYINPSLPHVDLNDACADWMKKHNIQVH